MGSLFLGHPGIHALRCHMPCNALMIFIPASLQGVPEKIIIFFNWFQQDGEIFWDTLYNNETIIILSPNQIFLWINFPMLSLSLCYQFPSANCKLSKLELILNSNLARPPAIYSSQHKTTKNTYTFTLYTLNFFTVISIYEFGIYRVCQKYLKFFKSVKSWVHIF